MKQPLGDGDKMNIGTPTPAVKDKKKIEYADSTKCGGEWGHIEMLFDKVNEIIDRINEADKDGV